MSRKLRDLFIFNKKRLSKRKHAFDYRRFPKQINLGCGLDKRDDFLNIDLNDFHSPDLVSDVSDLRILPSGYYHHILAKDVLEHIERPQILNTLKGWNRVLEIGGTIDFQVPSALGLLDLLTRPENQNYESHQTLLQCLFGTQTYEGDYHHFAFTQLVLETMFADAGFQIMSLKTGEGWLFKGHGKKIRDEFVDDMFNLSDDLFLDAIYHSMLHRDPDPGGKIFYLELLKRGVTRESIAEAIANGEEYKNLQK